MVSNPLTYAELEAYERKALVTFTAWETDLLMRLDDAVLAAWAGEVRAKPAAQTDAGPVEIEASNQVGIGAMLRGIAVRKATQLAKALTPGKKGDARG